jgi:CheY-like chemotaxis protein
MAFRVLCVDDDPLVLRVIANLLESTGYAVTKADSGSAAVAKLVEPFDAAILDYELPDTNGVALAREVKAAQPAVPVILFSGSANDLPIRGSHDLSAVVSKGTGVSSLLTTLNGLVRCNRL